MTGSIGPLVAADEFFNHQIVDTHASVLQTDHAWTEKVCGMACARDGSMSVNFGFGKYVNRNVVDGYGGASRGVQQWSVRASRALDADPDRIDVGPLRYEVVEPLRRVRIALERNATQPLAYELELEGRVPCALEEREDRRTLTGYRRSADQLRYHQVGVARGWVELEGRRIDVTPQGWVMTRDHSWGVRPAVGAPLADLQPDPMDAQAPRVLAVWNPVLFSTATGDDYAFMQYYLVYAGDGWRHEKVQGGFEFADGRREPLARIEPRLRFDARNKRLLGGEFALAMADGSARSLAVRVLGDTGFHLGAGLYHGFDGRYHGQWRGRLAVDGEHFADCSTPEAVARLNQFRDCLVELRDSATGATGIGNCQTWVQGRWPELGLPDG
ncbi:MAG: hypothetical protein JSR43_10055 [Proteobacteria bacterium]|nr:hypothetical protein [Pseudomonadota bacterium]